MGIRLIEDLDSLLSSGPVASDGLLSDVDTWCQGVAESARIPVTGRPGPDSSVAGAIERVVWRAKVNHAAAGVGCTPPDTPDHVRTPPAYDSGQRLDPGLWALDYSPRHGFDAFDHLFQSAMTQNALGRAASPTLPDAALAALRSGLITVRDHLPLISSTTLPLVHLVLVHRSPIESMYLMQLPETIVVNDELLLKDTGRVAEAILHESLHEKSAALRQIRWLLAPALDTAERFRLSLPWYPPRRRREFDAWRLLSAGHVYTHIALLNAAMGTPQSIERARECAARASFMMAALADQRFSRALAVDGNALVCQLTEALKSMPSGHAYPLTEEHIIQGES
ncbi:hypothetical protein [Streptomyces sp. NBC_00094]|uniref:hypothetical protein n=1 Tax=Streptomyces sp. NBC_00094 TaxID=2903620 RepID=UPI002258879D|nr:hypothetical protein [Streptomyces sp. NBC_00094]MCX5395098.1 hypothetical protein [Streptomyces sp. NBC_00094]